MNNDMNCDMNRDIPKREERPVLYAAASPYPPVKICEHNPEYGRMMLSNMGGQNSEMTAISLYIYSNLLIDDIEELSMAFRKIAIVEMHHLEIFGKIARMMGEHPRLWAHRQNRMVYWSPSYNRYDTKLAPVIKNSIIGEQNAVMKYQDQCRIIQDQHITACLRRIIEDEELHIELLQKLYDRYCS